MTKTRTGDAFMPAGDYGRALPRFSANLLVRNVATSLPFYRDVLGVTIRYADDDFAALSLLGIDFMLHADHAYDHHPLYARLQVTPERGVGPSNFVFSALIQTKWRSAQSVWVPPSSNRQETMPMAGVRSRFLIPTATPGPSAFQFPP